MSAWKTNGETLLPLKYLMQCALVEVDAEESLHSCGEEPSITWCIELLKSSEAKEEDEEIWLLVVSDSGLKIR